MLSRLYIATITHPSDDDHPDSGTDDSLALIANQMQVTIGDTSQDDLEANKANLYDCHNSNYALLSPGYRTIEDFRLDEFDETLSFRVAILGNDAWRPRHIALWGEGTLGEGEGGDLVPLAIATDIDTNINEALSTDPEEGNVSLPLRRVVKGGDGTVINRLLVAIRTSVLEDSGTSNAVSLTITTAAGNAAFDRRLPLRSDDDFATGQAYVYRLPVLSSFTRGALDGGGRIRLQIYGNDLWLPESIYLFGFDNPTTNTMVPLVWISDWGAQRLSEDPSEGTAFVDLPIAVPS